MTGTKLTVAFKGLTGGHSGEEINRGRANAITLMGRLLTALGREVRVVSLAAEGKTNAISNNATAELCVFTGREADVEARIRALEAEFQAECGSRDNIHIELTRGSGLATCSVYDEATQNRVASSLLLFPSGVMGLAQVPEGRRVFLSMTVQENLEMGAYTQKKGDDIDAELEKVFERFPRLKERRRQIAGTLSGGEQQMLAMGRALMSKPELLMLDEPSMGLSPILVDQIFDIVKELNKQGTTILLVEQNAQMALSVADRGYVLETGKIVTSASAKELLNDNAVKKAYLGG